MSNICNTLDLLYQDHLKFLMLMGDVAGHSIADVAWSRARSLLSPATKFLVADSFSMTPVVLSKSSVSLNKKAIFPGRGQIRLYIKYNFPDYESAACCEFLISGAVFYKPQSQDIPGVSHELSRDVDNANKVVGIIIVCRDEAPLLYGELYCILSGE